jgi:hypothetical protein
VPPNRRSAYEFLDSIAPAEADTKAVANKLGLPTNTARRSFAGTVGARRVRRSAALERHA